VSLADQSNSDGVCWPGINFIAQRTGLNRTTVMRNINNLIKSGLMEKHKRTGGIDGGAKSNVYTLRISESRSLPLGGESRSHDSESRTVRPEPPLEPPLSNNTYWTQENLEKEWAEFKAMRKQIKRPVNATAETRIIAKLKKLQIEGHPPSEVLDISTENCWKGVFAIKKENHNGHKRHHGQSQTTVQTPLDRCNEAIKQMDAEALAEDDSLVW